MPFLFRKDRSAEERLAADAREQLRTHGIDAPLRSQLKAQRLGQEGRHEEARRWALVSDRLRTMIAEG